MSYHKFRSTHDILTKDNEHYNGSVTPETGLALQRRGENAGGVVMQLRDSRMQLRDSRAHLSMRWHNQAMPCRNLRIAGWGEDKVDGMVIVWNTTEDDCTGTARQPVRVQLLEPLGQATAPLAINCKRASTWSSEREVALLCFATQIEQFLHRRH